jgi:hypothetical protein
MVSRREFIKFLTGLGLGASAIELYERLYDIPLLEKSFRAEINYWMNKYNKANEEIKKIESKNKSLNQSLKESQEKVSELTQTLSYEDELEKESTSAITFYKQQMNEAISKLKQTIEKYRILLGDERVSFELASLKALENLHITKENLDKVIKYFPLIKILNFVPTKIINDKIYDLNVNLEVISPINTLEKVEVKLIPVEYDYFITNYGMRKEDYPLVFPPEETRVVKLNSKGLEKENFEVDFKDLKGGKEYEVMALVKDTAGNERIEKIKTPYIREYENLGRWLYENKVIVSAAYMPWNMRSLDRYKLPDKPLLGLYNALNDIVQWKHIDWANACGINVFWFSSNLTSLYEVKVVEGLLSKDGVLIGAMPGPDESMIRGGVGLPDWAINLDDSFNREIFMRIMSSWIALASSPNYFRVGREPAVFIWDENAFANINEAYGEMKRIAERRGFDLFIISDCLPRIPKINVGEQLESWNRLKGEEWWNYIDALTSWIGFYEPSPMVEDIGIEERIKAYLNYFEKSLTVWKSFCEERRKAFTPTITPGFDNSYSWGEPNVIPLPRSVERFEKLLKIAIKYTSSSYREVRVDTWNDFGEWSYIEPSLSERFDYLNIVKEKVSSGIAFY